MTKTEGVGMDRIDGVTAEGAAYPDGRPGPAGRYQQTRQAHAACVVCGETAPGGPCFGLRFVVDPAGAVEAGFRTSRLFQGYDGMLHGGVIATLLDAAMVHCLFAHGIVAVTAEMTVRFLREVPVDCNVRVGAELVSQRHGVFQLTAGLTLAGRPLAAAKGKFLRSRRAEVPGVRP